MVNGYIKTDLDDDDYWFDDISEYQEALDQFQGVPYKHNGIFDELYNIKKFIEFNGRNIICEEKEFQVLLRKEYNPEEQNHESLVDLYSHKNSFRRFSYEATLLLIHSKFETRLKEFCFLLQNFDKSKGLKIPKDGRDNIGLIETIINDFLILIFPDSKFDIHKNQYKRIAFNFLRNNINHNSSIFTVSINDPNIQQLKRFSKERSDILLKWISRNRKNKTSTYRLEILKSTLLLEYVDLFQEVINAVVYKANRL